MIAYRLTVCGKDELDRFAGERVTHLLSLEDPGTPKETPRWHRGPHAQLQFHDRWRPHAGRTLPTREHVAAILGVGERCLAAARGSPLHLLVHCRHGSSRSGAAGYLLLAQGLGPGREADALAWLVERRPIAVPNRLMIALGDELLGRGGALTRALEPLLADVDEALDEFGLA